MLKDKRVLVLFMVVLSFSSLVYGGVEEELNKVIRRYRVPKEYLGIYIKKLGLKDGRVLYDLHGDRLMIPASLSKIPTAGAILSKLGSNFRYETQLWVDGKREGGVLNGNLYLKGAGDPSFVSEKMWYLVNEFRRTGITRVKGDIIVDDTIFDRIRFEKGRDPSRGDRAYDAPNGGMSFNWNTINIFVKPGGGEGQKLIVHLDPENKWVKLDNRGVTVKLGQKSTLQVKRRVKGKNVTIQIRGRMPLGHKEKAFYKNIPLPSLWAGNSLKDFLLQRGIQVNGDIKLGAVSSSGRMVAKSQSKPIFHIVADMMKFSNNYVAEMLTKTLPTQRKKMPVTSGTMGEGMVIIKKFLSKEVGLKFEEFVMVSPSGLSRRNKFTPKALSRILDYLRQNPYIETEFTSGLPVAGVDGTLKKRMKDSVGKGWIRAKTGYLSKVVGLAGFIPTKKREVISFVFIFNGKFNEFEVQRMFDQMAVTLVEGL